MEIKMTHCPSTGAYLERIARLGRTAFYCYPVITVVLGCIPFMKWDEMVVEGGQKLLEELGSHPGCGTSQTFLKIPSALK